MRTKTIVAELIVSDLETAISFYTTTFGLSPMFGPWKAWPNGNLGVPERSHVFDEPPPAGKSGAPQPSAKAVTLYNWLKESAPAKARASVPPCDRGDVTHRPASSDQRQSVATSSAAQISRIRDSLSRPMRSTSPATDTDSTESRLTTLRRGTGSSPGSSATSLARPRTVVVHGAISARRSCGIAASRDSTTTGRRPIPGGSHHHTFTSPRNVGHPVTASRNDARSPHSSGSSIG